MTVATLSSRGMTKRQNQRKFSKSTNFLIHQNSARVSLSLQTAVITPRFLESSTLSNILTILANFLNRLISFLWKTSVMTVATLGAKRYCLVFTQEEPISTITMQPTTLSLQKKTWPYHNCAHSGPEVSLPISMLCIRLMKWISNCQNKWRWAIACQIDLPDSLDTIQHHTVTFSSENIGQSFFNDPFE